MNELPDLHAGSFWCSAPSERSAPQHHHCSRSALAIEDGSHGHAHVQHVKCTVHVQSVHRLRRIKYTSLCRQLLHGTEGPLQRLLQGIMKASERSPQQIAAVAVHMCGLWVQFPASALSYLDIWEKLLLHGGTSASPPHPVRASH